MPLGTEQYNSFLRLTADVWRDKVFYDKQELPAGYFSANILNISTEEIKALLEGGSLILEQLPVIAAAGPEEMEALLPTLKTQVIDLAERLWKHPPFCFHDREQELDLIEAMFSPASLRDITSLKSEGRDFFLRYLQALVRIPAAIYHFTAAGWFFELDYLRKLKKRNETHFAVAAQDCFNSESFWQEMRALHIQQVEPFSSLPQLKSSYVFSRSPKNEKETVFVNRHIFDSLISFYTFDLFNGLHHGHAPSQCRCCGRYFLTTNGHIPKYCDGMAPQDNRMTCRKYGAMMQQKEKNEQHPVYRVFKTRTNTIRKHHQREDISEELRKAAIQLAEEYRDRALMDTAYAEDGYERDMAQAHIYAEAKKRLR